MTLRSKEIYVSSKTKRRLFWIKKLQGEGGKLTIDEIADQILTRAFEELYPNLKTLEKRLDALEDQLVSELLSASSSASEPTRSDA